MVQVKGTSIKCPELSFPSKVYNTSYRLERLKIMLQISYTKNN
jgi:hypothetical protein